MSFSSYLVWAPSRATIASASMLPTANEARRPSRMVSFTWSPGRMRQDAGVGRATAGDMRCMLVQPVAATADVVSAQMSKATQAARQLFTAGFLVENVSQAGGRFPQSTKRHRRCPPQLLASPVALMHPSELY